MTPEQIAAIVDKLPRGVVTDDDLEKFLKTHGKGLAQKSQQAIRDEFVKRRAKRLEQVATVFRRLEGKQVGLSSNPSSPVQGNPTDKNALSVTVTASDGNLGKELDGLRDLGRRLAGVEPTISVRDQWSYLGKKQSVKWPDNRSQTLKIAKIDDYPVQIVRTVTVAIAGANPTIAAAFGKQVTMNGSTTITVKAGGPVELAGRWTGTLSFATLRIDGGAGQQGCDLTGKVQGKATTLVLDIQGSSEAGTAILTAKPIQSIGQGSDTTARLNYRVAGGTFKAAGPMQQGTITLTGKVNGPVGGWSLAGSWSWAGAAGEGGSARGTGTWSVAAPKAKK
jgi:hypothetical protein